MHPQCISLTFIEEVYTKSISCFGYGMLKLSDDLSYKEKLTKILDFQKKFLCSKIVPLVKVLWCNRCVKEATREMKSDMREK